MKITEGKRRQVRKAIEDNYHKYHATTTQKVDSYVDAALSALNIEVEEPSVLPDISKGEWVHRQVDDARWNIWDLGENNSGEIALSITTEADAKFLAGSKSLAEAVIDWLEEVQHLNSFLEPHRAIIDALDDMGCDVTKFRKE